MSEKTTQTGIIVIITMLAVIFLVPLSLMGNWGMGHWMMGSRMMGFGGSFMFLVPVAFLVIIALAFYYLLSSHGSAKGHEESNALRILKERYAKGEITAEQYTTIKNDLES